VAQAEEAVGAVPGITGVEDVRLRWTGHRLNVDATVTSDPAMPVGRFHELEHQADQIIRGRLSGINAVRLNLSAHPPESGTFSSNPRSLLGGASRTSRRSRRRLHGPGRMLYQHRLAVLDTQTVGSERKFPLPTRTLPASSGRFSTLPVCEATMAAVRAEFPGTRHGLGA
jgi:Dimerisation domain of Zinc Transporter